MRQNHAVDKPSLPGPFDRLRVARVVWRAPFDKLRANGDGGMPFRFPLSPKPFGLSLSKPFNHRFG